MDIEVDNVLYKHPNGGGMLSVDAKVHKETFIATGAMVSDSCFLSKDVSLRDMSRVSDRASLPGKVRLYDSAKIIGNPIVSGDVVLKNSATIAESAHLDMRGMIHGNSIVRGKCVLKGKFLIGGNSIIEESPSISGAIHMNRVYVTADLHLPPDRKALLFDTSVTKCPKVFYDKDVLIIVTDDAIFYNKTKFSYEDIKWMVLSGESGIKKQIFKKYIHIMDALLQ